MEQYASASDFARIVQAGGDVVMHGESAPYELRMWPPPPRTLSAEDARTQPSRLLQAGHEIVEFVDREAELDTLRSWRDGCRERTHVAVRLIHGPGGQGKTRLAAQAARTWRQDGWNTFHANPRPNRSTRPAPEIQPSEYPSGTLIVVDYAQEWDTDNLLRLIHDMSSPGAAPVLILLLARSAGTWWQILESRLLRNLGIVPEALGLKPLVSRPSDRALLFSKAIRQFATALKVPASPLPHPPSSLQDHRSYDQVLTLHMSALATVLAAVRDTAAPDDPDKLSAYLLARERDHWTRLHERGLVKADANAMSQVMYIAALTGPLSYTDGTSALQAAPVELWEHPGRLIKEHAVCYTPSRADTVLEPLYPDRLNEDFLALMTPGHDCVYPADPWATQALGLLLKPDGAAWTRTALTTLAETAKRWPHVAREHLIPLLRERPELCLEAGSALLVALTELHDLDSKLVLDIYELLAESCPVDLIAGYVALLTWLSNMADLLPDDQRAVIGAALCAVLGEAGRYAEAVAYGEAAVALLRRLMADGVDGCRAHLAGALTNLSEYLSMTRANQAALNAVREAATHYRILTRHAPGEFELRLAVALSNVGNCLAVHLGRASEALAPADEAVRILRDLDETDPDAHTGALASALATLSRAAAAWGNDAVALKAAEESLTLRRRLADAQRAVHSPLLSRALDTFGRALWRTGRTDEALASLEESVALHRQLAEIVPDRFEPMLKGQLHHLFTLYRELRLRKKLVPIAEELVALHQRQVARGRQELRPALAVATYNLAVARAGAEQWDEACSTADLAADLVRPRATLGVVALEAALVRFLCGAALIRVEGQRSQDEVPDKIEEALAVYARLPAVLPEHLRRECLVAFEVLEESLAAVGEHGSALELRRRRIRLTPSDEICLPVRRRR
ncbi:tetratricopeptide repeat protein [Streptomyces sp. NPDC001700]